MNEQWWPTIAALLGVAGVLTVRRRDRRVRPARNTATRSHPAVRLWGCCLTRAGVPAVVLAVGVPAWLFGGPVAAFMAVVYAVLLWRGARRRDQARRYARQQTAALDALCGLAADLRAGLPPAVLKEHWSVTSGTGARGVVRSPRADRLTALAGAAVRLAERTGAPLADLLERVEADARAADRAARTAAAQAAGARATAWLLAALPLGGVALGYGIGVDPLRVLLHTPVGAGCAVAAVLLQVAGLAWADRLARPAGAE
jgi:tight adherence protein B